MPAAKTYFKLGIFVLLGVAGLVATALALGIRSLRADTIDYHTYFDESVQGLEVGAPVKYRGVSVGSVAAAEIAPDRRHVDVTLALEVGKVRHLGLAEPVPGRPDAHIAVPPDLRAQLGSQGITGVKFVNLDFFDPKTNPVPELSFTPAENTIPAAASLMKSLEDSLVRTLDQLPGVLDGMQVALGRIDEVLAGFQEQGIPDALAKMLANLDGAVSDLRRTVGQIDRARLPDKTAKAIEDLDLAAAKMGRILDQIDGDAGLVASAKRATDSVGGVGRKVERSAAELDRTLRDLGDAARAVRDFADELERDPEMLLKGKSVPKR